MLGVFSNKIVCFQGLDWNLEARPPPEYRSTSEAEGADAPQHRARAARGARCRRAAQHSTAQSDLYSTARQTLLSHLFFLKKKITAEGCHRGGVIVVSIAPEKLILTL